MALAMTWGTGWQKDASLVPPRLALGAAMLYHGAAKLRGDGPAQTGAMFEGLGIKPGRFWATATGVAEAFAGVASILGIATRPAALAVLVTQGMAVAKVHAPKGYDIMAGGMEYNLALMAIAAGLLLTGPGRLSAHEAVEDAVRRRGRGGGARKLWRRARPDAVTRAVLLVK
jgi:putative oxidoreductase